MNNGDGMGGEMAKESKSNEGHSPFPDAEGLKIAARLQGWDPTVPGFGEVALGVQSNPPAGGQTVDECPQGGATWLGKGSSKTPFS